MSKKQKCREKVKKTMHNTIYRIQPVTKNKQTNKQTKNCYKNPSKRTCT